MRRERSCQVAAIEVVGAVLREPLERAREIGHHEPVARDEPVTVAAVDHLSLACVAQDQIEDRVEIGLRFRQLDALPRVANRGLEQDRPGKRPEEPVRLAQPRGRPRDRAGRGADPERLRRLRREGDVHGLHLCDLAAVEPESRNGDEVVEHARRAVAGTVDEHEAARAGAGEGTLGDPGDEGRSDGRVHRVPALAEHTGARLGGERVAGGNCASHSRECSQYPTNG